MKLTRYDSAGTFRWALDDDLLPERLTLAFLLGLRREEMLSVLGALPREERMEEILLPPIEPEHEVWASGVTYLRSRVERQAESTVADVYATVYEAERPEIFFKAVGGRVVGHEDPIRIRRDSAWNVPEPELTLVINRHGEIVGYTAGNDVSSRSIEGENPLYLPQAKSYDGSCALGPSIILATAEEMAELPIHLLIVRDGEEVFTGEANISQMKRTLRDLVGFLFRELTFPMGAFLMTGTGIVPTQEFSLMPEDTVNITVGALILSNDVASDS